MRERIHTPTASPVPPSRRSLLPAARRVLWSLLRARACGPRRALRERLRAFLGAAGRGRLQCLLRDAAVAAVVAAALLGTTSPAQAIELSAVAAGEGGFAVHGEGRLTAPFGWSVADAGDVNGDGIPDAILGGSRCSYYCYTVPSYVVFGRADGAPVDLEDVAAGEGGFAMHGVSKGDRSGWSVSGTGDLNGDGIPDLAIAARGSETDNVNGTAYVVFGPPRTGVPRFRRGEVNGDLRVDLSDAVATLNYLFSNGDAPACFDAADANDDGHIDLSDAVSTLNYLFGGGDALPVPGPAACGSDPTDNDPLGCESPPEDCE